MRASTGGRCRPRAQVLPEHEQAVLEQAHVERGALAAVLERGGEQRVAQAAQLGGVVLGGRAAGDIGRYREI